MAIVACPFCREMFEEGEATTCPVCGMALTPFEKLPPSIEATEDGIPIEPQHERLPIGFLGRGRAFVPVMALAGLVFFFLPWIRVTLPDIFELSGFFLARRLGWAWGAGVAWVVLVPTVLSRRSIAELRGARVAAAFLAAIPAVTIAILLARPPHGGIVPIRFTYAWPLFASLASSILAFAASLRLGGRVDDIAVARGTSAGQALH